MAWAISVKLFIWMALGHDVSVVGYLPPGSEILKVDESRLLVIYRGETHI